MCSSDLTAVWTLSPGDLSLADLERRTPTDLQSAVGKTLLAAAELAESAGGVDLAAWLAQAALHLEPFAERALALAHRVTRDPEQVEHWTQRAEAALADPELTSNRRAQVLEQLATLQAETRAQSEAAAGTLARQIGRAHV